MFETFVRRLFAAAMIGAIGVFPCASSSAWQGGGEDPKLEKQETDKEKQGEQKLDPQEVMDEVRELLQAGEPKKALAKIEALVKQQPEHRNARLIAAQLNHMVGMEIAQNEKREDANKFLFTCAAHMRAVHKQAEGKLEPRIAALYATAIYNEACSLAVEGKKEKALQVLEESIDAGFEELEVLEKDEDFKSVAGEAKFKELVEKLRTRSN